MSASQAVRTTGTEFQGRRAVVMGLGRFGGGIGVSRWLARHGARVLVTDQCSEGDLQASVAALSDCDVSFRLGSHDESDLEGCDLLVVSPAVDKARSGFFAAARKRGIPWTSEMNLFLERCPGRIVGITGSVGKSTTTAMLGAILRAAAKSPTWRHGRVWMGGNIGQSLLDNLQEMTAQDVVILELSSFQLEDAAEIGRGASLALITNLRDNHLDRHGTFDAYAAAKRNIYRFQTAGDAIVLPYDLPAPDLDGVLASGRTLHRFGLEDDQSGIIVESFRQSGTNTRRFGDVRLAVPGLHNRRNAAGAVALASLLDVAEGVMRTALAAFPGLPHRLEFVREFEGVRYYNDSKATTPEAALTALEAFVEPVVLIAGGSDKGSSFAEFGRAVARRAKVAVCLGATRDVIASAIESAGGHITIDRASDLDQAVRLAHDHASAGDVIVLSPACASYDMFKNYEQRGEAFRKCVGSL